MTSHLLVQSSRGPYSVSFEPNIEDVKSGLERFLSKHNFSSVVLFSNPTVWNLYGEGIRDCLAKAAKVEKEAKRSKGQTSLMGFFSAKKKK